MIQLADLNTDALNETTDARELLRQAVDSLTNIDRRKELENWILKNFFAAYNRLQSKAFAWTIPGEAPDYLVFEDPDREPLPVEVTEVLAPGRKRDKEYRTALGEAERTSDEVVLSDAPEIPPDYDHKTIEQAREVLRKKLNMSYPEGTWLVVYFNAEPWGLTPEQKLAYARRILTAALEPLGRPKRLAKIWFLTNALDIGELAG